MTSARLAEKGLGVNRQLVAYVLMASIVSGLFGYVLRGHTPAVKNSDHLEQASKHLEQTIYHLDQYFMEQK